MNWLCSSCIEMKQHNCQHLTILAWQEREQAKAAEREKALGDQMAAQMQAQMAEMQRQQQERQAQLEEMDKQKQEQLDQLRAEREQLESIALQARATQANAADAAKQRLAQAEAEKKGIEEAAKQALLEAERAKRATEDAAKQTLLEKDKKMAAEVAAKDADLQQQLRAVKDAAKRREEYMASVLHDRTVQAVGAIQADREMAAARIEEE